MTSFTVHHNFNDLLRNTTNLEQRQIPFAASIAINRTLRTIKGAEEREIIDVFDRPTPYVQPSVFVKTSRKRNLTGFVGLKNEAHKSVPASKFLKAQITGGTRRLKRYEVLLKQMNILPDDYFTVPGNAATLDQYGNISRGEIIQILSFFRAFPENGFRANSTQRSRARLRRGTRNRPTGRSYSVVRPYAGTILPGVWRTDHSTFGNAYRPILIFVPSVIYEPIFDFEFVAEQVVTRTFRDEFNRAFREAISAQ